VTEFSDNKGGQEKSRKLVNFSVRQHAIPLFIQGCAMSSIFTSTDSYIISLRHPGRVWISSGFSHGGAQPSCDVPHDAALLVQTDTRETHYASPLPACTLAHVHCCADL
jgi:hypothetical protein